MNAATKRTIIATAALAAAGLFGSLPYEGSTQAQQGAPTVHRDVALVDILTDESAFDTALFNDVLGPTGAEEQLFTALGPNAATLLDTNTASPAFSGDFNGAESRLFEGLYLDTLASEDQLNQLLGVTPAASEAAILADYTSLPEAPLPTGDVLPVVGASGFDSDLTTIANGEFTLAFSDFEGFLANLATDTTGLSDVSTLLTDLSSSFGDLSNLSTDLSPILADLTGGLL
jgi:hypothetical protein